MRNSQQRARAVLANTERRAGPHLAAFIAAFILLAVFLFSPVTQAGVGWTPNGVPVCTTANKQIEPRVFPDGSGGAVVAWLDTDTDDEYGPFDVYAQRLNSSGAPLWAVNGICVCTDVNYAPGIDVRPEAVSDGSGGLIVTWKANADNCIYAQRISSAGTKLWSAGGVRVCPNADLWGVNMPHLASDGSGGAIIAWQDGRVSFMTHEIYAQRITSGGTIAWALDGVPVRTPGLYYELFQTIPDGSGGAIVGWKDSTGIFEQRVNASGVRQWPVDGVQVGTPAPPGSHPHVVSDGSQGSITLWTEDSYPNCKVLAQRVGSSGALMWASGGVQVGTVDTVYTYDTPCLASDGAGGAFVMWAEVIAEPIGYHAQRLNASGVPQWTAGGKYLMEGGMEGCSEIVEDGTGGFLTSYWDYDEESNTCIYVLKVNSSGDTVWAGANAFCADWDVSDTRVIPDGAGGAIVAWADSRAAPVYDPTSQTDIYAQKVVGSAPPGLADIEPDIGCCGQTLDEVSITGSGFRNVPILVQLIREGWEIIEATDVRWVDSTHLMADFALTDATPGSDWDLRMRHSDEASWCNLDNVFTVHQIKVTASASGGHGTVDPETQDVKYGEAADIYIYPDDGYCIASITDNDAPVPVPDPYYTWSYTIENVNEDHNVVVTFAVIEVFTVNASVSGGHATVEPETQDVWADEPARIQVHPDVGYEIASITDNGAPVPVPDPKAISYTIENVQENHDIVFTFVFVGLPEYTVEASVDGGHGSVEPRKQTVTHGDIAMVHFIPDEGYHPYSVTEWSGGSGSSTVGGIDEWWAVNYGRGITRDTKVTVRFGQVRKPEVAKPVFFFAEGTCRPGFDPYLCVQNPSEGTAEVKVTYILGDGTSKVQELAVEKKSRTTIPVKGILGEGADNAYDFSAVVESTNKAPIIAERSIYFDYNGWTGGHDVVGATSTMPAWYFAEGTCRPGFDPYLCIFNPGGKAAGVKVTYLLGNGTSKVQELTLDPRTRSTIPVKSVLGEGADDAHDFSAVVESAIETPVVAERSMYFDYNGWTGGHDVVGAPSPRRGWYFAEGTCRPGFDTYLCIQNPGKDASSVRVTYMLGDGTSKVQELTVNPESRSTIPVKGVLGEGADEAHDFSALIETTNNKPIIAERSMYFNYNGAWTGGHDVVGARAPKPEWYFAEGTCRPGFDPYLCILNPLEESARVEITYMLGDGNTKKQEIALDSKSRTTIPVKSVLGEGADAAHDFSARVEALEKTAVIVERSMYFNYKGWTGGHDVVGYTP